PDSRRGTVAPTPPGLRPRPRRPDRAAPGIWCRPRRPAPVLADRSRPQAQIAPPPAAPVPAASGRRPRALRAARPRRPWRLRRPVRVVSTHEPLVIDFPDSRSARLTPRPAEALSPTALRRARYAPLFHTSCFVP